MRIIRHSDDLGMTRQSTAQMLEAWRLGHLDGLSIIVNGDAVDLIPPALASASELPARLAVHLNLTEGRSSAVASEVPLLVDASGEFRHGFGSLLTACVFSSAPKRRELLRQIACECAAQVDAARALCGQRKIASIDGHIHVHMIPGIFATVARCAREAGISQIRISSEPFYMEDPWRDWRRPFWWVNLVKHVLLRTLSVGARAAARQTGLRSPGALVGVLYTGKMSAARALRGIDAAAGATDIEVVFHAGRANAAETARWRNADAEFHLSEWRDFEREELGRLSEHLRAAGRRAGT